MLVVFVDDLVIIQLICSSSESKGTCLARTRIATKTRMRQSYYDP
jgi:hypothetical protein